MSKQFPDHYSQRERRFQECIQYQASEQEKQRRKDDRNALLLFFAWIVLVLFTAVLTLKGVFWGEKEKVPVVQEQQM